MHLLLAGFLCVNDKKAGLFRPSCLKSEAKFRIGIGERIQQKLFD